MGILSICVHELRDHSCGSFLFPQGYCLYKKRRHPLRRDDDRMSKIDVSHLTFSYDGDYEPVFKDVSVQLDSAWRLGLIGRNGRGKTTLLQLLMGRYDFQGRITASVRFSYFPYSVDNPEQDTETVMETICPGHERWEFCRELSILDMPEEALDKPFCLLSPGEQTKVLLAALFCRDHAYLLIDEPTNHLDSRARAAIGRYLRQKQGFILVSHDRELLDHCVDHVLSINKADIEVQRGNFSSWMENKERRDQYEEAEKERLKKDVRRLETAARRTADWSDKVEKTKKGSRNSGLRPDRGYVGHKAAKMMKRSQAIDARRQASLEETKTLLKNAEGQEPLKMEPLAVRSGRLVELEGLTVAYGKIPVCRDVTFFLTAGDRIALCGRNGCGKSSLLRLICSEDVPHTGTVRLGSGVVLSYIPQNTARLSGTPLAYAREAGVDENRFKAILSKMEVPPSAFGKDMTALSDGQRKKVLLARSLCEKAHVYIWDEPLNFLDVLSRVQIEELLLSAQPTMLFVEHDETFCRRIATRVITLGE